MSFYDEQRKKLGMGNPSFYDQKRLKMGITPVFHPPGEQTKPNLKQFAPLDPAATAEVLKKQLPAGAGTVAAPPDTISTNPEFGSSYEDVAEELSNHPAVINAPDPSRQLPVIGTVLKGLDKVKASPIQHVIAEIGQMFAIPGAAGITVAGASAKSVAGFAGAVERGLAKLFPGIKSPLPGLETSLAGKVTQKSIAGAATGATVGVGQALATGEGNNPEEVAKQAAIGAGLGGTLDAAAPLIAKYGPKIGQRLSELIRRNQQVPSKEHALYARAANQPISVNSAKQLDRVMTEIKPLVTERMTPPLENPNELAKWLKPHLGDVSLNEVRKLPYGDLINLADEVKRNLTVYDTAVQIAKEHGYNLPKLLEGFPEAPKLSTLKKNAAYGIYPVQLRRSRLAKPLRFPGNSRTPSLKPENPEVDSNFNSLINTLRSEPEDTLSRDLLNSQKSPGNTRLEPSRPPNPDENPLLANSDDWKNKATLALKRETMERNFDDIMGKDAPAMKKTYLEPIKDSETERIKFLNRQRDDISDLGIKYKSKDDQLVQLYGEGEINIHQLQSRTPHWRKIVRAAEYMRSNYDELLNVMNKALTENGYPPVPKRKNYFPHYQEIDNFFTKLGFDVSNFDLPTEVIGRTQDFKPGKKFFAHALRRRGKETTYGAIEGFDRYVEGASRVIFHTNNIKRLRTLEKDLRDKYENSEHLNTFVADLLDYTNHLAGKQSAVDRGWESLIGRKIYTILDSARKRVGLNMIGLNISSAMTNFVSATHALATTDKAAIVNGVRASLLNLIKNDGFDRESGFLTRRIGSDALAKGKIAKAVDASMMLMRGTDEFVSNMIVRSKYLEGLNQGLSKSEALKRADDWAAKILADRSLGQMPTMFNSKSLGIISQFQLEVNNQLSFLLKDIPRSMNKGQVISALSQAAVYAYLLNLGYKKVFGRKVALDPVGILAELVADLNDPEISKGAALGKAGQETLNQLPFTSFLTGGRFPLSSAVPNPFQVKDLKTAQKEAEKPLVYLFPPTGGSQVKKIYQGLTVMGKNPLSPQKLPGLYQTNPQGEKYLKYPIKDSPANNLRTLAFGQYSTPESNEYYDKERRPLSPAQTKEMEKSKDPLKFYNNLMIDRRIQTLKSKKKQLTKKGLTREELTRQSDKLNTQIMKLRKLQ